MADENLLARRLEWDDARTLAGESIELFPGDGAPPVVLDVTDAREVLSTPRMLQFRLLFRGPAARVHAQGIYRFRHARLGDYAFFITPVGASADGTDYEACFAHAR